MSNIIERIRAAEEFAQRWSGQGYEKDQTQLFWSELLSDVMGIKHPSKYISFMLYGCVRLPADTGQLPVICRMDACGCLRLTLSRELQE